MGFTKYIPASLALILACGEGYLTYSFLISNSGIPEGTAFTLTTLGPSISATFLALAAFIGLFPGVREKISGKYLSENNYRVLVVVFVILSLVLAGASILSGSMEYTRFQDAVS